MGSLTVIIPSRNEEWLNRTIEGVVTKMRGDTSVIAVMDGAWPVVAIPNHPRVHLVYHPASVGQRAAVNEAVRIATSDYVMKLDAHCDVDEGFDVKLMDPYETGELSRDVTTIPRMYNLHAFDWQCRGCGTRTYQGPMPVLCKVCEKTGPFERVIVWQPRMNRLTDFARFDCEPHFQYFSAYKHRPAAAGELPGVMSSVGACCFMRRDRWWELGGLDEEYGSWGSFGIEIACKSWLSGGQQIVNKRTWFSHLFRTQPGFSFPYHMPQKQAGFAKARAKKIWFGNEWPGQTRPLSWLIDHFAPVPGWHEPEHAAALADVQEAGKRFYAARGGHVERTTEAAAVVMPSKGILYFSDDHAPGKILGFCRARLLRAAEGIPIVSVTLTPLNFGRNVVLPLERSRLTMLRQIVAGLEALDCDVVFFAEHDVAYHASHFIFEPPDRERFYFNANVWRVDMHTGRAVTHDMQSVSGLCASRPLLLDYYRAFVADVERDGYNHDHGYEPGVKEGLAVSWRSETPNVDIRHGMNLTASRWDPREFHDKDTCRHWTEADGVPGWGTTKGRFDVWLQEQW